MKVTCSDTFTAMYESVDESLTSVDPELNYLKVLIAINKNKKVVLLTADVLAAFNSALSRKHTVLFKSTNDLIDALASLTAHQDLI